MSGYADLKRSEKNRIDQTFDMIEGYVLDFSNRAIEIYFEDEFQIEFCSDRFEVNGNSKANRLRTILEIHTGGQAAQILRNLWDYRSSLTMYEMHQDPDKEELTKEKFFQVVAKLEGMSGQVDLQPFASFDNSNTLHELLQSIERDIRADKPHAAIDRLHLFCTKRFRHLVEARGVSIEREEPLNSVVGRYKKILEAEGHHSDMALLFIRYSISVFEKFNDIRNNRSLAHDNDLLDINEAKFIFDAVGAVLRFIKTIDSSFDA